MPVTTIPLVGEETRRGLGQAASTTKDQVFKCCTVVRTENSATQSANYYLEKRPALDDSSVASAGDIGTAIFPSPSLSTPSVATTVLAFGATNSKIWVAGDRGTITGVCFFITETIIGGVTFWLLGSSNGTGWYLASDSYAATAYTADGNNSTTITDIKISGVNSTAGLYSGQLLAAASNIVAGTRIVSVDPATFTAVLDTATTGGAFNDLAITKTPVAKILSANFPSMVGGFAVMDGFLFVMTATGRVYNSDINSITSWQASNFISANISTDTGLGVITYKNHIVAFGNKSVEWFYNAGNAFGSVLSSRKEYFSQIGMYAEADGSVVTQVDDRVYWVGDDLRLYTFDGFSPVPLTAQGMKLGSSGNNVVDAISSMKIGSDTIIHVTSFASSTAEFDKWFSVKNRVWTEPTFTVSSLILADNPIPSTSFIGYAVSASDTAGKGYELNVAAYQDDAVAFSLIVQTQPYALNKGHGFTVNEVRLLADNQASGSTTLETSADDYGTWVTRGTFDMTKTKKDVHRGGFYRSSCAFRLTHSANTAWRGQAIEVDWEPAVT